MPQQKDLKRRVRARMQKTGESYTSARVHVTAKQGPPAAQFAEIAGMSDEAVANKTGKNWKQWVTILDKAQATSLSHKSIAAWLHEKQGVSAWWAQAIAVAYERIRGLRDKGQRRGGGYDVNKSKTLPVPVSELYAAFGARKREKWLGEVGLKVKTSSAGKSMRITWEDGSPLDVYFWEKGPARSQVQLQHREHATKAAADERRAFWTERLAALTTFLKD